MPGSFSVAFRQTLRRTKGPYETFPESVIAVGSLGRHIRIRGRSENFHSRRSDALVSSQSSTLCVVTAGKSNDAHSESTNQVEVSVCVIKAISGWPPGPASFIWLKRIVLDSTILILGI